MQAQTEPIQQQKREIRNQKAAKATGMNPQLLEHVISQAMSCLYVVNKKTPVDSKEKGGKQFVGTRPPNQLWR